MIRLVQRKLIIPRGDTGTFSVPVLSSYNSGDKAVFSIIDPRTQRRIYNQLMDITDSVISVRFEHGDTVNLPVGKFLWDIKFYQDPVIDEGEVISGKEIDSYYAAFTMPECEVRQTGDNMLTADDAPGSTLTPQQINAINAALLALNEAVEKTETNVMHYPTIINGEWNVWDANLEDYSTTGVEATGNGIASIEKTNIQGLIDTYTVNFTDGTTFLYNITNGDRGIGISSITKQSTSGLIDTYIIAYTDGESTTFTVTNGATPNITIGTVQEGPIAAASITGSAANPVLNLTLPNANVPTKVSELENDAGYLTTETDPTVPAWAKAPTKPTYTPVEVGALPADTFIPSKVSDLEDDSGHYTKPVNGIPASDLEETYLTSFTEADPTVPQWAKQQTKPTYTAQEVGALPNDTYIPEKTSDLINDSNYVVDANYTHTDNNYTTAEKEKLSSIAVGAEVNVNADWNAVSGDAQILNKPTNVSAFTNDSGYLTTESDPTVPAWAKAAQKPTYTAAEVGATTEQEVNGMIAEAIGQINSFDMAIVQTLPTQNISTHTIYLKPKTGDTNDVYDEYIYINNAWEMIGNTQIDLSDYALKSELPTNVSELTNDSGYLTSYTETDPTVPAWAKAAQKPSYTATEVGALPSNTHIPSTTAELTNDAGFITSAALPTKVSDLTNDAGYLTQHQDISGKVNTSDLAAVATSGSYNDLNNKPSIPTKVSDLIDDSGHYTKPTTGIPASDLATGVIPTVPVQDVQVNGTSILSNGVANVPAADNNSLGVVMIDYNNGIGILSNKKLYIQRATDTHIKEGTNIFRPITPQYQHVATFYGLATAAGDTTQASSSNAVGNYTDNAKAAIQQMLDVPSTSDIPDVPVQDVQINGTSILSNDIANIPVATTSSIGVMGVDSGGGLRISSANMLTTNAATSAHAKAGTNTYYPIVSARQHESVFYGLAKAAGDTTQSQSSNAIGQYTDTAKATIRSMIEALGPNDLIDIITTINGLITALNGKSSAAIPSSSGNYAMLNAQGNLEDSGYKADGIAFYGLAKAAGDTTQSQSSNAFGTYTDDAKVAIKSMLGITTDVQTITVSDTNPTINAIANARYICGEVSTISITPPTYGICDVIFTSGSSVAVLTLPNTVKLPTWFDSTALETDTIYEINIVDGVYGAVATWQS